MYDEYDSVRFLREPPPLPPFLGALADFLEGVWGGGWAGEVVRPVGVRRGRGGAEVREPQHTAPRAARPPAAP